MNFAFADEVPDEGRGTLQHDTLQDRGQGQDYDPNNENFLYNCPLTVLVWRQQCTSNNQGYCSGNFCGSRYKKKIRIRIKKNIASLMEAIDLRNGGSAYN